MNMSPNKFPSITTKDGIYEISVITKDTLPAALAVIQQAFFVDENVSIATRVSENPQAIEELSELCVHAAQDGVSLIAIEKSTGMAASANFNKLQVPPSAADEDNYFEAFEARCAHPSSRALMRYMIDMEKLYDVFEERRVRCTLEIMFIGTLRAHRDRQLGTQMWGTSMEIARRLAHGDDVRVALTSTLPVLSAPECVTSLATSNATARIASKFDFETLLEIPFERFQFEGKTFAERIGPETKSSTLVFKVLQ